MNNTQHLLQKHFDTALESPDGIKKLRKLILSLAMQGKLVKQDPKDQPASELLKEIQAEKERLASREGAKTRRMGKELPPIKPEVVPYEVPSGWVWVNLREVTHEWGQKTPDKDFIYIDVGSIDNSKGIIVENPQILAPENAPSRARKIVKQGTVIYSTVRPYLLNIAIVERVYNEEPIASTAFAIMHPFIGLNGKFLYRYLNSQIFIDFVESKQKGVAYPAISDGDLFQGKIPLPPLAEQKRIVAKIDELMALCDKLEAQRKARNEKRLAVHRAALNQLLNSSYNLRESAKSVDNSFQFIFNNFDQLYSVKENVAGLKKAILTLAMQGKLVKQDPKDQPASELLKEIQAEKERLIKEGKIKKQKELPPIKPEEVPYAVPEGWVWTRLGEVGETQTGTTPATKDSDNFGDYIPFIGPGDILNQAIVYNNNGLSEKGINNSRLIQKYSILMVCIGGSIGKHAINTVDVACNQQINTITPFTCDVKFLFYSMWSDDFQNNVVANAGGSATPIINKNKWSMILIPLPPLAEQKRIVAKIDELMALCDKLEKQIEQATAKQTALFDAVLAKA